MNAAAIFPAINTVTRMRFRADRVGVPTNAYQTAAAHSPMSVTAATVNKTPSTIRPPAVSVSDAIQAFTDGISLTYPTPTHVNVVHAVTASILLARLDEMETSRFVIKPPSANFVCVNDAAKEPVGGGRI